VEANKNRVAMEKKVAESAAQKRIAEARSKHSDVLTILASQMTQAKTDDEKVKLLQKFQSESRNRWEDLLKTAREMNRGIGIEVVFSCLFDEIVKDVGKIDPNIGVKILEFLLKGNDKEMGEEEKGLYKTHLVRVIKNHPEFSNLEKATGFVRMLSSHFPQDNRTEKFEELFNQLRELISEIFPEDVSQSTPVSTTSAATQDAKEKVSGDVSAQGGGRKYKKSNKKKKSMKRKSNKKKKSMKRKSNKKRKTIKKKI
jgi:hypothetical protein